MRLAFFVYLCLLFFAIFFGIVTVIPLVIILILYCVHPDILVKWGTLFGARAAGSKVKHIQAGEFDWCYREAGNISKPTIILVHGYATDSTMWSVMVRQLLPNYHIIAPDIVGFGKTKPCKSDSYSIALQVDRLETFLQSVIPNRCFHIAGTSMGGHIAGVYAAKYVHRVLSVNLICPAGLIGKNKSYFMKCIEAGEKNILLASNATEMRELLKYVFYKAPFIPHRLLEAFMKEKQQRLEVEEQVMGAMIHPTECFLLQCVIPYITAKVCVQWGKEDKILDVTGVDILQSSLITPPDVLILDKTGHGITTEKSRAAYKHYRKFLKSLDPNWTPPQPPSPLLDLCSFAEQSQYIYDKNRANTANLSKSEHLKDMTVAMQEHQDVHIDVVNAEGNSEKKLNDEHLNLQINNIV